MHKRSTRHLSRQNDNNGSAREFFTFHSSHIFLTILHSYLNYAEQLENAGQPTRAFSPEEAETETPEPPRSRRIAPTGKSLLSCEQTTERALEDARTTFRRLGPEARKPKRERDSKRSTTTQRMQAPVKPEWKPIRASVSSLRMTNPIRALLETIKVPDNPDKEMIDLSIGTWTSVFS
jgi:hypothetical protein